MTNLVSRKKLFFVQDCISGFYLFYSYLSFKCLFRFINPGMNRLGFNKLSYYFDDVDSIVFIASLSDYDVLLDARSEKARYFYIFMHLPFLHVYLEAVLEAIIHIYLKYIAYGSSYFDRLSSDFEITSAISKSEIHILFH